MSGNPSRSNPCRIALIVATLAAVWAWTIFMTGGFLLQLGTLRVSSRSTRNPVLITLAAVAAGWVLAPPGGRRQAITAEGRRLAGMFDRVIPRLTATQSRWLCVGVAGFAAVGVMVVGVRHGAFVATAADPYGYVSQAHLWLTGTLRVALPAIGQLPDGIPTEVLAPLGYRLGPDRASLVPMSSPGFPVVMAMFEWIGGPGAMFYVMPLLAGVVVWATYLMGTLVNGRLAGVIAALLLATSPAFLFQLTHGPMSDIPAMAWWSIALVLMPRSSRWSALLSGAAVGVAIFTRPNLVPLVLIPAAFLWWDFASMQVARRLAFQRLLLFVLPVIPACLAVGMLNEFWYGSPLASGYGPLAGALYRWDHFWPNLTTYTQRMINSHSPAILAAAAAPILLWRHSSPGESPSRTRSIVVAYSSFAFGLYVCYAFYAPLDTWWTLRFLFPAYPIVFVFLTVSILALRARLPQDTRALAIVLLVGALMGHHIAFGRRNFVLDSAPEWRFATIGHHIAQHLPERAVFFAMRHGGSARYYSGRLTVRWDLIDPPLLERAVEHFQRLGYEPFLLVDRDEEHAQFVARFAGGIAPVMLDREPMTTLAGVSIYDLSLPLPASPPASGQLK